MEHILCFGAKQFHFNYIKFQTKALKCKQLVVKLVQSKDDHDYDLWTYHMDYFNCKTSSASDVVGVPG